MADDHPVVRLGIQALLSRDPAFQVIAEAKNAAETLQRTVELQPDLIILDMGMPGRDGLQLVMELRQQVPKAALLIFSGLPEAVYAPQALAAGARGYVEKEAGLPQLLTAVRSIAGGGVHASASLQHLLLQRHVRGRDPASGISSLSPQELNVFRLLGQGCALKEVAEKLGISVKTVGTHRERMKEKLGVSSSRALQQMAQAQNSTPRPPGDESVGEASHPA